MSTNFSNKPYIDKKVKPLLEDVAFPDQAATIAENLLDRCKHTLESARRPIEREPYQIKFFFETGIMRLRLDAFAWFDYILPIHHSDPVHRARIAREYVRECLERKHKSITSRRIVDPTNRVCSKSKIAYICMDMNCRSNSCRRHVPQKCREKVRLIHGDMGECSQHFATSTFITSFTIRDEQFVLYSRLESARDILLFPVSHSTNEYFARSPKAWQAIAEVRWKLCDIISRIRRDQRIDSPIESVEFNVGSWTSEIGKNKYATIAHAHAHLALTPEAISAFDTNINPRDFSPEENLYILNLTGCYRDPVDHEYNDAIALQHSRILFYHIEQTEARFKSIEENMVTKDMLAEFKKELFEEIHLLLENVQRSSVPIPDTTNEEQSEPAVEDRLDDTSAAQILLDTTNTTIPPKLSRWQKKKAKKRRQEERKQEENKLKMQTK
ncbi:unnamed protein product [Adineta ricciae]|uniref:Uncharacterized protein n=1 Tax=Adineta ricciae TaxID=249248 RepID=A0A815SHK1_ADIRI|nr:unnamed protein product [Adineta ricciae]CAF1491427.1 unnamed protein product [Adineta ricciae]